MNPTKDKTELDILLESLESSASTIDNPGNMSGNGGYEPGYGPTPPHLYGDDTITLSSYPWSNASLTTSSITGGGYTVPNVTINSGTYSVVGAGTGISLNPWAKSSAKIQLDGEDADIKVNGWSLVDAIQQIEQRLNILHPNTELETEWEELRALGKKYRELEQHIKDKQATWDRLKAMPAPDIE